jgi:hypothetical protein
MFLRDSYIRLYKFAEADKAIQPHFAPKDICHPGDSWGWVARVALPNSCVKCKGNGADGKIVYTMICLFRKVIHCFATTNPTKG